MANRNPKPPPRLSALPIDSIREDVRTTLRSALRDDDIVLVVAPTGSGKSTRLPGWMLEDGPSPVIVVEPRRVAARSLATFVARERGGNVGGEVGYRVRFEDRSSAETKLLFVTPGVALRMLQNKNTANASFLLDEFHERGWETDLVLTRLRERREGLCVVTSATVDVEDLAPRLGAKVLRAEGRSYPVDIEYRDEPGAPSPRDLDRRVADEVRRALDERDGDVLVFLPGRGEIGACSRMLRAGMQADVEVVEMHGSLAPDAMQRALASAKSGRRVTLATNVAETSLTLPGVRTVVDSGLMRSTIHRAGRTALALVPAPLSSLDQRAGRAGRVAPGVCIRLFSSRYRPDATAQPEVERMELDDLVLQAAAIGLEGSALDAAPWPTSPPPFALDRARVRLRRSGAIDVDGCRTALGCAWADLPVAAESASFLHDAPEALRGTLADIVALTERDSSLFLPFTSLRDRDDVEIARTTLLSRARNEVDANILALRRGDARMHGLHRARLEDARKLSCRLRRLVQAKTLSPREDDDKLVEAELLAHTIASRRPAAAFVRRPRADKAKRPALDGREPWANGSEELWIHPWTAPDSETQPAFDAGVVLGSRWNARETGRGVRGIGSMLIPCARSALAVENVGERKVLDVKLVKGRSAPRIFGRQAQTLADVVLHEEEVRLSGEALREAVASFIAEGRLFSGVHAAVEDAFHVWEIAAIGSAANVTSSIYDGASDFLRKRLAALGLEESADLALIDATDLDVDLEGEAGVTPDVASRVLTDFPRVWEYQGARYAVTVDVKRKRVRMEAVGNKAMKAKDPPAGLVPRFRGFAVEVKRASRVVRLR